MKLPEYALAEDQKVKAESDTAASPFRSKCASIIMQQQERDIIRALISDMASSADLEHAGQGEGKWRVRIEGKKQGSSDAHRLGLKSVQAPQAQSIPCLAG